ncbi:hypothetical protein MKK68_03570 [Methylobacterium sp. E-016]|uniref:hypothetical protein n=1 Tax=Methylobacterium sp. E-016 TaxID=2836556 RepID=UPI001FB961DD|nr:hypothetical protein [Methylobacterium sp. E-016]MCJ2074731.1 hypothetical protein [Methylobacterium sp. E-016]
MSLATTADTTAITPAPLSKYEIQRNERHAASQAASNAKRRSKNAPRRDDMARAAYYALLMMVVDPKIPPAEKARLLGTISNLLEKAGFDRAVCREIFKGHAATVLDNLDGWLAQRWYAEGRRLADNRGRYVPLKRISFADMAREAVIDVSTAD